MTAAVRIGIRINAPRETVFPYLLTPHHLARWFCNFAQVDPKVGGKFRFGGDYCIVAHPEEGGGWETVIRAGEVLRRFAFSWPLWDATTEVEIDVEDRGGGSLLRTSHTGLPREWSTCGSFVDAWRLCLGNLKAIAEGREDSLRPDSYPVPDSEMRFDLLVDAPVSRTFGALSEPAELDRWAGNGATVELIVGGRYSLGWGGEDGRILRWDAGRAFECAWTVSGASITSSAWVEEKGPARTSVHLRLRGWPPTDERFAKERRCLWSSRLVDLKNYLEAGETGFTEPRTAELSSA